MESNGFHVLLVDDDHPYVALISKVLSERGHVVTVSSTGREIPQKLEHENFDIILLDYKMEGMSGINVLQWMYGKKIKIPVILITNFGSDEIVDESVKWGAVEYFMKGEKDAIRLPLLVEQICKKNLATR
jgi:DNA-binding NtrC family response regulator